MSELVPGITDGELLLLLVVAAAGPFVALAGHGTIAWVAIKRFFARVSRRISEVESKADTLDVKVSEVVTSIRKNMDQFEVRVMGNLPGMLADKVPDLTDKLALLEERMGAKLTASLEAKWTILGDELSQRMGQVIQANIASAKARFANANRELSEVGENDGSLLTEVAGIFMDEDSVKKLAKAKNLFKRMQAQGGLTGNRGAPGQVPQGGYAYGSVSPDGRYVATPQGWKALQQAPAAALAPPARAAPSVTLADIPPELPPEPKPT